MSACDQLIKAIHEFGGACLEEGANYSRKEYQDYKKASNEKLEAVYEEIRKYRDSLINKESNYDQ